MNIANELLDDADATSSDIARKYDKPLSTIQRRRTRLERTILAKDYAINTQLARWRSGEIFIKVEKGRAQAVGKTLFERYKENITLVSTTMNNIGNLIGHIYYNTSPEMFSIVEELRRIEFVEEVMYAEHIEKLGERKPRFILETIRKPR